MNSVFMPFVNGNKGGVITTPQKARDFIFGNHINCGLPMDIWMALVSENWPQSEELDQNYLMM